MLFFQLILRFHCLNKQCFGSEKAIFLLNESSYRLKEVIPTPATYDKSHRKDNVTHKQEMKNKKIKMKTKIHIQGLELRKEKTKSEYLDVFLIALQLDSSTIIIIILLFYLLYFTMYFWAAVENAFMHN